MEKLEQEVNAPEKMAETPSPKKTAGKKKKFRKNQVIITALAIMIAVAGYINYADSTLSTKGTADGTTADTSTVLKDISSLDTDITDEVDAGAAGDSSRTITETPGEAVLAGASTYMAQARIDREQIRSQNKDTLNEIINNTNLSETERQSAVQSMVEMTDLVEKVGNRTPPRSQRLHRRRRKPDRRNRRHRRSDERSNRGTACPDRRHRNPQNRNRRRKHRHHPHELRRRHSRRGECSVNFDIHVKNPETQNHAFPDFFT